MDMTLGTSAYVRDRGNFPELAVVNMFAESSPTDGEVGLLSRSGLSASSLSLGTAPVRQLYQEDGVLSGDLFGVSGNVLYRNGSSIGNFDGNDFVSMAGYQDFLFLCAGRSLLGYDGASSSPIPFPDDADVIKVCVGASRLIAIRGDTQIIYWTDPLETTIDALSFASAESSTDRLVDMLYIGDTLILGGKETVEFWPSGEDADLPFLPLRGRTFEVGVKNTGAMTKMNATFAWVNNRNQVCISTPEKVISFPGLEALIKNEDAVTLFQLTIDGDTCLALRLTGSTWIYHSRSKEWSTFTSYGYDNWIVNSCAGNYFGSSIDGTVLEWSTDYSDKGGILERSFFAWVPVNEGGVIANDIILRTNPGHTPFLSGGYSNPEIEMRTSRDGGMTWGNWRSRSIGLSGNYRKLVEWDSCGMFSYPGVLCQFRLTPPVPFRVPKVLINSKRGGI